jgi:hypothetical protein
MRRFAVYVERRPHVGEEGVRTNNRPYRERTFAPDRPLISRPATRATNHLFFSLYTTGRLTAPCLRFRVPRGCVRAAAAAWGGVEENGGAMDHWRDPTSGCSVVRLVGGGTLIDVRSINTWRLIAIYPGQHN